MVHMDGSSLVFIPLEDPKIDLVAVVEITRHSDVLSRTTPMAVRTMVLESHRLFNLRRGGVHDRLQTSTNRTSVSSCLSLCQYPGMDVLYKLRRLARALEKGSPRHDEQQNEDPAELYATLPISSLKHDLSIHYSDFLANLSDPECLFPGSCRSVAQGIHTSVPAFATSCNLLPLKVESSVRNTLDRSMQEFIDQVGPPLVGLSLFAHNQHVSSRFAHENFEVSKTDALLVLRFMITMKEKVTRQELSANNQDGIPRSTGNRSSPLWQFLPPPPLSLLGSNDDKDDFEGANGQRVWLPTLHFNTNVRKSLSTCLLWGEDYGLLLYTHSPPPASESAYKNMFERSVELVSSLFSERKRVLRGFDFEVREWSRRGVEVLVVDNAERSLVLYKSNNDETKKISDDTKSKSIGLVEKFRRLTGSKTEVAAEKIQKNEAVDARAKFAAKLSLASLLAFDDSLGQAESFRNQKDNGHLESCTALKNSWMYTSVSGSKEVHALFDPLEHVTVSDVRSAAKQIRESLIRGKQ